MPPIGSHASQKIHAACQPQDGHSTPWTKVAGRQALSSAPVVEPERHKESDHVYHQTMGKHDGLLGVYRLDSVSVWDARVSVVSVVFVTSFRGFVGLGICTGILSTMTGHME